MDFTEQSLILISAVLMIAALILSFVPIMPGPVMVWAVAIIFAVAEGFERMTPVAVLVATLVMLLGSASDLWLPLFGIRTGSLSCLSTVGAFAGGMIGTFFIPVPIIGTLIGSVLGALLVEFTRGREMRRAIRAGKTAARNYLLSYVVQLVASIIIFVVYVVSVQTTG